LSDLFVGDKIFDDFEPFTNIFYGDAKIGKSLLSYGINKAQGRFAVVDFDGNTKQTLRANFSPKIRENFKTWELKKKYKQEMKGISAADIPNANKQFYDYLEDEVWAEIDSYQPNFEIYDGYQRLVKITEQAMRFGELARDPTVTAFSGIKNRNAWKRRNWYLDKLWDISTDRATDAVLVTVHETEKRKEQQKQFRMQEERKKLESQKKKSNVIVEALSQIEDEKEYVPTWAGNIKEETWVETRCYSELDDFGDQMEFFADCKSNKLTKRVKGNINVTDNLEAYWAWLLELNTDFIY